VEDIEDFLRVEDFAYGVERNYSTDRWALVGEAAAFADPFYSPGSDFIGYSNTFAADLIVRDLDGEDVSDRVEYYNQLYQRAFEFVIAKYRDLYPVFGNSWVSCGMITWGFFVNHTGITLLTLTNKLTDIEFMKSVDEDLDRFFQLSINMCKLFGEWHQLERRERPPVMTKIFPALVEGLLGLVKDYPDDEALREEIRKQVKTCEAIAVAMFHKAASALPEPPDPDVAVNPYVVGLDPRKWESDGLFNAPGLTLAEANRIVPGVEVLWDDSINPFAGLGGGPPASVAGEAAGGGPPAGVAGGAPAGGPPA
jgi:hypothetical protein